MDSDRDHHHTCSWVGEYLHSADDACACNDLRALERQVAGFDYRLARAEADGFHRGVRAAIAAMYFEAGAYEVAIAERADVAGARWLGLAQRIQRGAERCAETLNEAYEASHD